MGESKFKFAKHDAERKFSDITIARARAPLWMTGIHITL